MSKGSLELIQPIIVTKIVLLRKKRVPHTFEEKIFSYFADHCDASFQILQFGDEETSYGTLPLALINENHVIQMVEFIPFAQALYKPNPELYLTQKAVIDNCLRLKDFNKLQAIEQQSEHWLLFNPLKRMRQFLNYKYQSRILSNQNISSDNKQNTHLISKAINQFEQLLEIEGEFPRIVQYLCLDYLIEHKNEIGQTVKLNKKIMDFYRQGIPDGSNLGNPIISDLKKADIKQPEAIKNNSEETLQTVLKTLGILSLVWMPWLIQKRYSEA